MSKQFLISKLRFFKLGLMPQALFFFSINAFFNVKCVFISKLRFFKLGLMPQALFFFFIKRVLQCKMRF